MISAAVHLCSQNRQLWKIWKFYRKASAIGSLLTKLQGYVFRLYSDETPPQVLSSQVCRTIIFRNTYEKLLLDILLVKNINQFSPYRTGAMFTIKEEKEFAQILTVSSSIYISKSQFTIFKNFKLPPKHCI